MKPLRYVFCTSISLEISSLMTSAQLLYTFPQSVGIAGGRPGESYYFVGSQADNPFYLDPHYPRPAIPLHPAPSPGHRELTPESDRDGFNYRHTWSPAHQRAPTSPPSDMDHRELNSISSGSGRGSGLDPAQEHYCSAYSATELWTFHCERVRKMPLSGLDPSMLIGFLCRDEAECWDFNERVAEVCIPLSLIKSR